MAIIIIMIMVMHDYESKSLRLQQGNFGRHTGNVP